MKMDANTLQALAAIAEKLGTTAEYLRGVLIKQAPISGAIDLILLVALTIIFVFWLCLVMRKTTLKQKNEYGQIFAEWEDGLAAAAFLSVILLGGFTMFLILSCLPTAITAFVNPEYWAFKQIIK